MKQKDKYMFMALGCFLVLSLVFQFAGNYAHEMAHKRIAEYNGCKVIEMKWGFNPYTLVDCKGQSQEVVNQVNYLDSENEIKSYNTMYITPAILVVGLVISLILIMRGKNE